MFKDKKIRLSLILVLIGIFIPTIAVFFVNKGYKRYSNVGLFFTMMKMEIVMQENEHETKDIFTPVSQEEADKEVSKGKWHLKPVPNKDIFVCFPANSFRSVIIEMEKGTEEVIVQNNISEIISLNSKHVKYEMKSIPTQKEISIPYKYFMFIGVLLIFSGIGIIILNHKPKSSTE